MWRRSATHYARHRRGTWKSISTTALLTAHTIPVVDRAPRGGIGIDILTSHHTTIHFVFTSQYTSTHSSKPICRDRLSISTAWRRFHSTCCPTPPPSDHGGPQPSYDSSAHSTHERESPPGQGSRRPQSASKASTIHDYVCETLPGFRLTMSATSLSTMTAVRVSRTTTRRISTSCKSGASS